MRQQYDGKNIAILFYARVSARVITISLPAAFNRFNVLVLGLFVLFTTFVFAEAPKKIKQTAAQREAAARELSADKHSAANKKELKRLIREDKDPSVRSMAIQGLGGRSDSLADLTQILNDTSETLVARETAASALSLSTDEATVGVLLNSYKNTTGELNEHIRICLEGLRNRFPARLSDLNEVQP